MNTSTHQVAVVTGAGGTLCSEMAKDLAKQGYRVALLGRTMEKLQVVEEEIRAADGVALSVSADVADEAAVRRAQEIIEQELGVCSVLINGAGGNQSEALTDIPEYDKRELLDDGAVKGFFNLSMETFQSVIDINTMGTVIPCFVFGRGMAKQQRGNIINFAFHDQLPPHHQGGRLRHG